MMTPAAATKVAVADALRVLTEPGQVVELRILNAPRVGTVSGYFDDPEKLADAAARWSGKAPAVYVTPNPVNPALLARANNRLVERVRSTTADADVVRRARLFLDFDAVRPAGISSTDAEHAAALERAAKCRDFLFSFDWPSPIEGDSGNGAHLVYRIDLPNDDAATALVQNCLHTLDWQFSDAVVSVDVGVYNAARIWKLYGTVVRKGDSTPDRPHRVARLLHAPLPLVKVPRDLLEALAARRPKEEPKAGARAAFTSHAGFDLAEWVRKYGLDVAHEGPWQGGHRWVLSVCPWNDEHDDRSAFIVQRADGKIAAGCHHNSCQGNTWRDLRQLYEPECYDRCHEDNGRHAPPSNGAATPASAPSDRQERLAEATCLNDIQPAPVEWLWPGRVPFGAVTILDGDPGIGKSLITLDLASRASTGRPMPNEADGVVRPAAAVLLLNAEDDLARTIRPRLDAMGADLSRVFSFESVPTGEGPRPVMLPLDLAAVERIVRENDIRLVVFDPFMAFLDGETDSHKDSDIRRLMYLIRLLAERTQAAVVVVRHLNKLISVSEPLYRGGGSIGIVGAARSALLVGKHPDDKDAEDADVGRRVLVPVKNNLCAAPQPLEYRVVAAGESATVEWLGVAEVDGVGVLGGNRKAKDAEAKDARRVKDAGSKLLSALDKLDPDRQGVARFPLRTQARVSHRDMVCALQDLIDGKVVVATDVTVKSGKGRTETVEGVRRPPETSPEPIGRIDQVGQSDWPENRPILDVHARPYVVGAREPSNPQSAEVQNPIRPIQGAEDADAGGEAEWTG